MTPVQQAQELNVATMGVEAVREAVIQAFDSFALSEIADIVETLDYETLDIVRDTLNELGDDDNNLVDGIAIENANKTADVLKDYDGLICELKGKWLWVKGKTKENKDAIKLTGCRYCPQKTDEHGNHNVWVFVSKILPPHRNQRVSMAHIERTYGTQRQVIGRDPHPDDNE